MSSPAPPPSTALAYDPLLAAPGRVFVGGVGNPWLGDLDFGPQFIRRYYDHGWAHDVRFHDVAISAHRVLDVLQEVAPSRVIFVAGWVRGDPPGTIRRRTPDLSAPDPEDVAVRLGEAATGIIDFDHTLVVARYFQALPPDTVMIEVEAVNEAFTTEFSPTVEASFEPVLEMVKAEIARSFGA